MMKFIIVTLLSWFSMAQVFAFAPPGADAIVGVWLTQDEDGKIEIYKKEGKYYGKLIWGKELKDADGKLKLDKENPDKELRSRTLKGLVLLKGFIYNGDNEWEKGKIYDPQNGKTYNCTMELSGDELKVTGYIGFSWIGRTVTWTKVK